MKPEHFPEENCTLGSPFDWNEEENGRCSDLPIQRKDGACISCWSLTEEERKSVAEGEDIYVHILSGETQPTIMLWVGVEG